MKVKFKALTALNNELYGLSEDGVVYIYKPRTEDRFAFWAKLTSHTPNDNNETHT